MDGPRRSKAAIIVAIAAGVAIAAPIAERFEAYRGGAYYDPAHILTQCYGETRDVDPSRIYSKDECATKLRARMRKDYAPRIIKCVPSFVQPEHYKAYGAAIDASYNAGPVAVCQSTAAKAFNAGDYRRGCNAFVGWYTSARNRKTGVRVVYPGLVRRRLWERDVCLEGLN